MGMVTAVERDPYMNSKAFAEHLRAVGQAIIDDAESIAMKTQLVRSVNIRVEIAPGQQLTYIDYEIERLADPRRRENKEDEQK